MSLSDLRELSEILVVVAGDWEVFLIALGVTGSERARIKAQHAHSPSFPTLCLVDGLEGWVKCTDRPTYEDIITALNSQLITNKPLATQLEEFAQRKSTSRGMIPLTVIHNDKTDNFCIIWTNPLCTVHRVYTR